MTVHAVIPDTQVKPGLDFSHLTYVGECQAAQLSKASSTLSGSRKAIATHTPQERLDT